LADQERIQNLSSSDGVILLPMSTIAEQGVTEVMKAACDSLLQQRTQTRLRGKRVNDIANRVFVATPTPRDNKERPPADLPPLRHSQDDSDNVVMSDEGTSTTNTSSSSNPLTHDKITAKKLKEQWEKEMYLFEQFDTEFKGIDHRERYQLENPEWRFDIIPEIMDGKNVFDFWSADIEERLEALEQEEAARLRRLAQDENTEEELSLTHEQMELVKKIRQRREFVVQQSRLKKGTTDAIVPRQFNTQGKNLSDLQSHLESLGLNTERVTQRLRDESRSRSRSRPGREVSQSRVGRKRSRSELASRSRSKSPGTPGSGFRDEEQFEIADRLAKRAKRELSRDGRRGESDRHVFDWKPKHLLSGKRGVGKADRR